MQTKCADSNKTLEQIELDKFNKWFMEVSGLPGSSIEAAWEGWGAGRLHARLEALAMIDSLTKAGDKNAT